MLIFYKKSRVVKEGFGTLTRIGAKVKYSCNNGDAIYSDNMRSYGSIRKYDDNSNAWCCDAWDWFGNCYAGRDYNAKSEYVCTDSSYPNLYYEWANVIGTLGCYPNAPANGVRNGKSFTCNDGYSEGSNICNKCGAGTYATGSPSSCSSCSPGKYQDLQGQSSCKSCPEGKTSGTGATSCTNCPAGQTSYSGETCYNCPTGSSSVAGGVCRCSEGSFLDNTLNSIWSFSPTFGKCVNCAAGKTVSAGTKLTGLVGSPSPCTDCPAGQTSSSGGTCRNCPTGSSSVAGGLCKCIPGYESNTANTGCIECEKGKQSKGGGVCTNCPAGTYQDTKAQGTCKTCPPYSTCASGESAYNQVGQTSFTCKGGYKKNGTVCEPCPAGQSSTADGNCTGCPAGQYSVAGGLCTVCPAGFYCPNTSTKTPCVSGSYCPAGSTSPQLCPAGKSSTAGGNCTDCPLGQYSVAGGLCTVCPAGFYCPNSSTKIPCSEGSYCPASSTTPQLCPPGKSSPANSQSSSACTPCPIGKYNDLSGSTCKQCSNPESTKWSAEGSTICSDCPANSSCTSESSSAQYNNKVFCNKNFYNNSLGTGCIQCPNGSITTAAGTTDKSFCYCDS